MSSTIYTTYREILDPSVVSHVVACNFTSPTSHNLIVVKSTKLEIYNVDETDAASSLAKINRPTATLSLVRTIKMHGVPSSIQTVRTAVGAGAMGRDSLLMAFPDAKLSLVEWQPEEHDLVTASIHYYEREDLRSNFMTPLVPTVHADPDHRCCILRFYGDKLAVLPFKQQDFVQPTTTEDSWTRQPFLQSFVLDAGMVDRNIKNIVDIAFLHGYFEPTVAILYEPYQTWTGRLAARRDTVRLIVVSIDLVRRVFATLFTHDRLPYNSFALYPLTTPLGGVLILGANGLVYVDQTTLPGVSVSVNKYFGMESKITRPPPPEQPHLQQEHQDDPYPNPLYGPPHLTSFEELGISLHASIPIQLDPDTLLFATQDKQLIKVELIGTEDAGRGWMRKGGGVRKFHVAPTGISSIGLPHSIIRIGRSSRTDCEGYALLACKDAESIVFRFESIFEQDVQTKPAKLQMLEEDEDDLYGTSTQVTTVQRTGKRRLQFYVTDNLATTGPVKDMHVSEPTWWPSSSAYPTEEKSVYTPTVPRKDLELLSCSGYESSGALTLHRRNVSPVVVGSLAGLNIDVKDMWGVREGVEHHKYLLLSSADRTTILDSSGQELVLDSAAKFYREGPTVSVGSLGSFIAQVTKDKIFLLSAKGKRVSELDLSHETKGPLRIVQSCDIIDPYILLLMSDAEILLIRVQDKQLVVCSKRKHPETKYRSIGLYTDNGNHQLLPKTNEIVQASQPKQVHRKVRDELEDLYAQHQDVMDVDEEAKPSVSIDQPRFFCTAFRDDGALEVLTLPEFEQVLYSPQFDLLPFIVMDQGPELVDQQTTAQGIEVLELVMVNLGRNALHADAHLFLRTDANDLIIYKAFVFPGHADRLGVRWVRVPHGHLLREPQYYTDADKTEKVLDEQLVDVAAIRRRYMKPVKRVVGSGGMVYEGVFVAGPRPCWITSAVSSTIPCTGLEETKPLDLWFQPNRLLPVTAIHVDVDVVNKRMTEEERAEKAKQLAADDPEQKAAKEEAAKQTLGAALDRHNARHRASMDDSLLGPPSFKTGQRILQVHPMIVDGEIKCFSDFSNPICQDGFVFVNGTGTVRLCQLNPLFDYSTDWPRQKIRLNRTPHKIALHTPSETLVVSTSRPIPFISKRAEYMAAVHAGVINDGDLLEGGNPMSEPLSTASGLDARLPGAYRAFDSTFRLDLISPVTYETIDTFEFGEYEHVLDVQAITLTTRQTVTGKKLFIVVGTGYNRGEDLLTRGKIYIFDVIEVVPEPGRPQTNHKLKLITEKDDRGFPGPVTKLCGLNGYIVGSFGTKLLIFEFEDDTLQGVAFMDINMYTTSLTSIRNMVLVGDFRKSVWFMGFQEEPSRLGTLARDYTPMQVMASECLIDFNLMHLVVSDDEGNVYLFAFDDQDATSAGGSRLVRKGEFHLGSSVTRMIRLRRMALPKKKGGPPVPSKQHATLLVQADGSLGFMIPIPERMYKRLQLLNSRLHQAIPHPAGLNPRGFRKIRSKGEKTVIANTTKPVLDGELLYQFMMLPVHRQRDFAKSIGSSVERIMDDLLEVELGYEFL